MNTYNLTSTPLCFTPGIVAYLKHMASTGGKASAKRILQGTFATLPASAIERLLKGDYTVDGDTVQVQG